MDIVLPDKLYYTIGEIAKAFNVNASLIRFWEKEFSIISPRKTSSGSRKFSPDDVKKLQLIYHLVKNKATPLKGRVNVLKKTSRNLLQTLMWLQS